MGKSGLFCADFGIVWESSWVGGRGKEDRVEGIDGRGSDVWGGGDRLGMNSKASGGKSVETDWGEGGPRMG